MAPSLACRRCVAAARVARVARAARRPLVVRHTRPYSTSKDEAEAAEAAEAAETTEATEATPDTPEGAMSRRLQEATEEALLTGGRAGRRAVEDAGFSDDLKSRLLGKIADATFHAEHGRAISAAGLDPTTMASAGHTSAAAAAAAAAGTPWTGTETTGDAVRRMLQDAHKPLAPGLRGKPRVPEPVVVDLRLNRAPAPSPGQRLSAAREKAASYAASTSASESTSTTESGNAMTPAERDAYRAELRERFTPIARTMPNTVSGLAALANERIENAIARGQFRHIPRGPGVERDARADNPFIDTTEYIMNKMIQRQDMVPPWIEKQQELTKAATAFRRRLRDDWTRHAARAIASRGGSLQAQMAQAERYARAERAHNPRSGRDTCLVSTDDRLVSTNESDIALTRPFRDPAWEAAEQKFLDLSVQNLNTLTRSYNLMAPELAKKPYFSLERELAACFADVAPTLAQVIKARAVRPAKTPTTSDDVGRRVLDRIAGPGGTDTARVYDSKAPKYGFKEFWGDLWKK